LKVIRDPDVDPNVRVEAVAALGGVQTPAVADALLDLMTDPSPPMRAAALKSLATADPENFITVLSGLDPDPHWSVRAALAAALAALEKYGAGAALPVLQSALNDKDWAVRVRAAGLIKQLDPNGVGGDIDASIRPAPTTLARDVYAAPRLVAPTVSTQAYLDTDRGMIQIELAMNDAPLTVENFVTLARRGYFNGLSVHRVVP